MIRDPRRARPHSRKFDHDAARQRHAAGEAVADLAREYGVHYTAVREVVDDAAYLKARARQRDYMRTVCEDCGGVSIHNWYSHGARNDRILCKKCSGRRRSEEALLGRLDENGDILCRKCGQHRSIDFYILTSRGVPRWQCRPCESAARREHRHANADATRAYDRDYKRRRRQEAS